MTAFEPDWRIPSGAGRELGLGIVGATGFRASFGNPDHAGYFATIGPSLAWAVSDIGVATGMNTVMRTVGGAVGTTIGGALLTATVVGSGAPTEAGFTEAFTVSAGAGVLALAAALIVPRPRRDSVSPIVPASVMPTSWS